MTLTPPHPISSRLDSVRLGLLYFVALSASLGTAVSAIGRLLLYLAALVYLLSRVSGRSRDRGTGLPSALSWAVLLAVAYMALSVLWSTVGPVEALWSWSRHARILTILIMLCLITSLAEARAVLRVFVWGQLFVVFSAWLLVLKLPVPWATGAGQGSYAVYSSYLEQGISQAVLVALLWFQRDQVFGPRGRWLAVACALATALLTIGLMRGRTGHLVLLGLLAFGLYQALPQRFRWTVLMAPLLVGVLAFQLPTASLLARFATRRGRAAAGWSRRRQLEPSLPSAQGAAGLTAERYGVRPAPDVFVVGGRGRLAWTGAALRGVGCAMALWQGSGR